MVLHTHLSRIHHVTSSIIPGIYSVIVCLRIGQTRQIGIGILRTEIIQMFLEVVLSAEQISTARQREIAFTHTLELSRNLETFVAERILRSGGTYDA